MDDFLFRALIGGVGVALCAGPFGSFVVWRRLAYFGDTLAHSALLGVVLGLLFEINLTFGVILICQALALLLFFLQRQKRLGSDTLLGILSHSALAVGLVGLTFMESVRVDLLSYLFGDILAIGNADLGWIYGGGAFALGMLLLLWRSLLSITVNEDLARVEGIRVDVVELVFFCLMALVVAIMMKVVGLILVTALLIIPAATARRFSRGPEMMAAMAALFGCLAVAAGLYSSGRWDTPAGPSIVVAAAGLFVVTSMLPRRFTGP